MIRNVLHKVKRPFALFVALVMVLALLPAAAFAEEEEAPNVPAIEEEQELLGAPVVKGEPPTEKAQAQNEFVPIMPTANQPATNPPTATVPTAVTSKALGDFFKVTPRSDSSGIDYDVVVTVDLGKGDEALTAILANTSGNNGADPSALMGYYYFGQKYGAPTDSGQAYRVYNRNNQSSGAIGKPNAEELTLAAVKAETQREGRSTTTNLTDWPIYSRTEYYNSAEGKWTNANTPTTGGNRNDDWLKAALGYTETGSYLTNKLIADYGKTWRVGAYDPDYFFWIYGCEDATGSGESQYFKVTYKYEFDIASVDGPGGTAGMANYFKDLPTALASPGDNRTVTIYNGEKSIDGAVIPAGKTVTLETSGGTIASSGTVTLMPGAKLITGELTGQTVQDAAKNALVYASGGYEAPTDFASADDLPTILEELAKDDSQVVELNVTGDAEFEGETDVIVPTNVTLNVTGGTFSLTENGSGTDVTVEGTLNVDGGANIDVGENCSLTIGGNSSGNNSGTLNVVGGMNVDGDLIVDDGGVMYITQPVQVHSQPLLMGATPFADVENGQVQVGGTGSFTVKSGGILIGYWLVDGEITVETGGILTWDSTEPQNTPTAGTVLVGNTSGAFIELTAGAKLMVTADGTNITGYELTNGGASGTANINPVSNNPFLLEDGQTFTITSGTLTAKSVSGGSGDTTHVTVNMEGSANGATGAKIDVKTDGTLAVEQYARVVLGNGAQIDNSAKNAVVNVNGATGSFGIVDSVFTQITPLAYVYSGSADAPERVVVAYYADNGGTNTPLTTTNSVAFGTSFDTAKAALSSNGFAWDNYEYTAVTIVWSCPTYNAFAAGAYPAAATVTYTSGGGAVTGPALTGTITVEASDYTLGVTGINTGGGLGNTATITASTVGGSIPGKVFVVVITEGSGGTAKNTVVAYPADASTTVSYAADASKIEVWLASAIPNLSNPANPTGATIYSYKIVTAP